MHRLAWETILWATVLLATFDHVLVVNARNIEENVKINELNTLSSQQNKLVDDVNAANWNDPVSKEEKIGKTEEEDETVEVIIDPEAEADQKQLRKNRITDILVSCFFFVAAIWLILATGYSVILLVLLRLQARGELDIYDENLGRVVLFNGKITLHFGCILRRYAIQLEEDYQMQLHRRFGDSNAENEEPQRIRIMTREERRKAVEELLGGSAKTLDVECGIVDNKQRCTAARCHVVQKSDASKKLSSTSSPDTSLSCSEEGPVCSICLLEYEPADLVFRSKSCPHMFHGECLFSWLERRNNTECPCCREPLVSDDDIWNVVQRMRKERREMLLKENGLVHRFVMWTKSKSNHQNGQIHPAIYSVDSDRTDSSSTSLSRGSDDESVGHQDSPSSSREINPDDNVRDNTDYHEESSSTETISVDTIGDHDESSAENNVSPASSSLETIPDGIVGDNKNDHDESSAQNIVSYTSSLERYPDKIVGDNTKGCDESSAENNV